MRRSAQLCQNNTIGLATKTEEYVPTVIPQTSANEKACSTGPPQMKSATTVRNVRPDVITVRLSVWLMLLFISDSRGSRRKILRFSRIRSKITIVSFIE